jgi:hypothetical protein
MQKVLGTCPNEPTMGLEEQTNPTPTSP